MIIVVDKNTKKVIIESDFYKVSKSKTLTDNFIKSKLKDNEMFLRFDKDSEVGIKIMNSHDFSVILNKLNKIIDINIIKSKTDLLIEKQKENELNKLNDKNILKDIREIEKIYKCESFLEPQEIIILEDAENWNIKICKNITSETIDFYGEQKIKYTYICYELISKKNEYTLSEITNLINMYSDEMVDYALSKENYTFKLEGSTSDLLEICLNLASKVNMLEAKINVLEGV